MTTQVSPPPVGGEGPDAPVQYETAKGCLSFVVIALVLGAIVAASIIIFGEPPAS